MGVRIGRIPHHRCRNIIRRHTIQIRKDDCPAFLLPCGKVVQRHRERIRIAICLFLHDDILLNVKSIDDIFKIYTRKNFCVLDCRRNIVQGSNLLQNGGILSKLRIMVGNLSIYFFCGSVEKKRQLLIAIV